MKTIVKNGLLTFAFALLLSGCANDSTDDLIDPTPISENVTYAGTIKSIVDNNCIQCHGAIPTNGAPMALDTYDKVKNAVLNRNLIDRISRQAGDESLMPQGGPKLPQTKIDEIIKWQETGFKE